MVDDVVDTDERKGRSKTNGTSATVCGDNHENETTQALSHTLSHTTTLHTHYTNTTRERERERERRRSEPTVRPVAAMGVDKAQNISTASGKRSIRNVISHLLRRSSMPSLFLHGSTLNREAVASIC